MPIQMGRLTNLQVLTTFVVGKDCGSAIKELGKLPMLGGKLLLYGLENVSGGREASMANMKGKKHLKNLTLEWKGDINDSQVARDVLESLEPHSSINHLKINGYHGTRFPKWLETPSFCSIESLSLSNCAYCFHLPALGQIQSLKSLEIVGMSNISAFTEDMYFGNNCEIEPFPSLQKFKIENMQELERWDIPECEVFCSLEKLYLIDCPKLNAKLPKQLLSLRKLEISGCNNLVLSNGRLSIFDSDIQQLSSLCKLKISRMEHLKELSPELNKLDCLERLEISDCGSLISFPLGNLPTSLKKLVCNGCGGFESESTSYQPVSLLEELKCKNCNSLKVVSLGLFPTLKDVQIKDCKRMEVLSVPPCRIGNGSSTLTSLQCLKIWDCDNLISFPEEGLPAPNLRQIEIVNCEKLKFLPARMESLLPSLRKLDLCNCPEIECFPKGGLPTSLQSLYILNCKKLLTSPKTWDLLRLPSLRGLRIDVNDEAVESFPNEDWLLPCTLEYLDLRGCQNLKMLNYSGLQHLTSLQRLRITWCRLLQSLPEEGLPTSLTKLEIRDSPLLKPRLEWEKGQDWPKVAHIPCIIVDEELIP
ncbi:putative disease resistance protein At3g14460 [Coffea arabica]|uniref:Disease resistance protein At3g14460 n=1 Tax=Coffea arabica TaxID=13443 RepID=A0ABM4WXL5_COFAR